MVSFSAVYVQGDFFNSRNNFRWGNFFLDDVCSHVTYSTNKIARKFTVV